MTDCSVLTRVKIKGVHFFPLRLPAATLTVLLMNYLQTYYFTFLFYSTSVKKDVYLDEKYQYLLIFKKLNSTKTTKEKVYNFVYMNAIKLISTGL